MAITINMIGISILDPGFANPVNDPRFKVGCCILQHSLLSVLRGCPEILIETNLQRYKLAIFLWPPGVLFTQIKTVDDLFKNFDYGYLLFICHEIGCQDPP